MKILDISAGMSLGFINDFHISKEKIGAARSNWSECLSVMRIRGVKTLVVGGDLFESRHSQTLNVLLSVESMLLEANALGIHVILANGNHDKVNQESELGYCHLYKYMPNVTVIDTYGLIESPSANIFILAYFPETGSLIDKIRDIESSEAFSNGKKNILYAHAGVLGALGQEVEGEIDVKSFVNFDKVYMGHYHGVSKMGNVKYIGASRQYTYGEDYIKGYNICDADGDLTFIQNKVNDRMITVRVDYEDIDTLESFIVNEKSHHDDCTGNIHIRAVISANKKESELINKDYLRSVGVNRIEIKTVVESIVSVKSSFYKKYDKQQIKEAYKEYCDEQKINPEIGLDYLK